MSVLVTYSSNNKIKIVSEFIANRIDADSIEIKDLKRKNGFSYKKRLFQCMILVESGCLYVCEYSYYAEGFLS